MKRKWKILFALLAAAVLVLAAGCSDDSSDAWTDEAASQASESDSNVAGGDSAGDSGNVDGGSGDNSGGASEAGGEGNVDSSAGGEGNVDSSAGGEGNVDSSAGGEGNVDSSAGGEGNVDSSAGGEGNVDSSAGGESNVDSSAGGESGTGGGGNASDSASGNNSGGGDSGNVGNGDNSGGGDSGAVAEEDAATTLIEISEDDVEALLKSIGKVEGNTADDDGCYWNFADGTLAADDDGACTFTVEWGNSSKPTTDSTLSSLQEKGKVGTSLLVLDLSGAEWAETPKPSSSSSKTDTGTVAADIELADGASASHAIPESLKSVTIALKSDIKWIVNTYE